MNDDEIPVRDVPPDDGEERREERTDGEAEAGDQGAQAHADDPLADLRAMAEGARTLAAMVNDRFVAPLVRGYPEVADHLAAAGTELAAVFRTVLRGQEQQWNSEPEEEHITIAPTESPDPENPESVGKRESGEDDE